MKNYFSFVLISALVLIGMNLSGCGGSPTTAAQVNITTASKEASEGLDLQALGALVQKAQNSEDLEKELNKPDGINNLDLNDDSQIDYIKVSGYGDGNYRGFSFAVEFPNGETQHVAEIEIQSDGQNANVQVTGNQNIYGQNAVYSSHLSLGDAAFIAWLFSPNYRVYVSPYGYGRYPGYYAPVSVRPMNAYRDNVRTVTTSVKTVTTKTAAKTVTAPAGAASPYQGKVAEKSIRTSLKNPTASQKSFQVTDRTKGPGAGGFGKSKSSATTSAPAPKVSAPTAAPRTSSPKATAAPRTSSPRSVTRSTPAPSRSSGFSSSSRSSRTSGRR